MIIFTWVYQHLKNFLMDVATSWDEAKSTERDSNSALDRMIQQMSYEEAKAYFADVFKTQQKGKGKAQ